MHWTKDKLKDARVRAKLSQQVLAEKLGVHRRTVQNWEKGISPISSPVFPVLDRLFGIPRGFVPLEEHEKVLEALHTATELNRKLSEIIQKDFRKTHAGVADAEKK